MKLLQLLTPRAKRFVKTNVLFMYNVVHAVDLVPPVRPFCVIRRQQAVLHAAARLITGYPWNDHITPTLCDTLHWLPVSQHITFKIVPMTYDCIHDRSPVYFRDICSPIVSVPFRSRLRSADNNDMIVRTTMSTWYSFCIAAHQIWNMLPPHLKNSNVRHKQFKSGLKTWLFVQAYSWGAPLKSLFKRRFTNTRFDWLIDNHKTSLSCCSSLICDVYLLVTFWM